MPILENVYVFMKVCSENINFSVMHLFFSGQMNFEEFLVRLISVSWQHSSLMHWHSLIAS